MFLRILIITISLSSLSILSINNFDENLGFTNSNLTAEISFKHAKEQSKNKTKRQLPKKLIRYAFNRKANNKESQFLKRIISIYATRKALGLECHGCAPGNWGKHALFFIATGKTQQPQKLKNNRVKNIYRKKINKFNRIFKRKLNISIKSISNKFVFDNK